MLVGWLVGFWGKVSLFLIQIPWHDVYFLSQINLQENLYEDFFSILLNFNVLQGLDLHLDL